MTGMMKFDKKGKLAPQYIGPFLIIKRIGKMAYQLKQHKRLKAMEGHCGQVTRIER